MIKANINKWNASVEIIGDEERLAYEMLICFKSVYDSITKEADKKVAEVFRWSLVKLIADDEIVNIPANAELEV